MSKKEKRTFSNIIIWYCVVFMSVYLWRCLDVLVTTGVNPSTCVTVAGAFFGGELLFVCLSYVFGNGKVRRRAQPQTQAQAQEEQAESAPASDPDCTI